MLFYRKNIKHKKNMNVQLHAWGEGGKKKYFFVPTPHSDLNTFVLHGASFFFIVSLASLLDVSNVMPIKSTHSPARD